MKKIQLPQGTIRVDETADIGGDNCWTSKGLFHKSMKDGGIFKNFPHEEYSETYWNFDDCFKIIASSFFIDKDVPMYYKEEDDVEELAENTQSTFYQEMLQDLGGYSKATHKANFNNAENPIYGYIKGYKAAQSKGCYTEEDLRETISETRKGMLYNKKYEDEYIQSLKDKVEFEMDNNSPECGIMDRAFCIQPICECLNTKFKTTRDENGQLWCYLKK